MAVFDQREQIVKGVQINVGGKFEEDIDPRLAVELCKALGITKIYAHSEDWITAEVNCIMTDRGLTFKNANVHYTLAFANSETGAIHKIELIIGR